jgi:hypothetical protein
MSVRINGLAVGRRFRLTPERLSSANPELWVRWKTARAGYCMGRAHMAEGGAFRSSAPPPVQEERDILPGAACADRPFMTDVQSTYHIVFVLQGLQLHSYFPDVFE